MNNDIQYLHFTIGPVQGFVAQARRTRDFWAGSFILSWLTAVAMRSVQKQEAQGKIIFPKPDENYLNWIEGQGKPERPVQGSVPNRFKALKAEVPKDFDPHIVVESVQTAWRELAEIVWKEDLADILPDNPIHRQIWDRQISSFFEISWALTDDPTASNLLDRRKNWRNHLAPAEPGIKCMIMDGWQELSGTYSQEDINNFWAPIRTHIKNKRDLAENEHLCAIAFVKRRFAQYFGKLGIHKNISMPGGGWQLKGWTLETGVPSVSYLAVAHWLANVIKTEDEAKLTELQEAAHAFDPEYGEWKTDISCITTAVQQKIGHTSWRLKALDGRVFFEDTLLNEKENKPEAKRMLKALKALSIAKKPSPFYAILLMDGDSLGKHMSDTHKQPKISDALDQFTREVPDIVKAHNGFLVYAGGDDVLAIHPIEDALACAKELRDCYLKSFKGKGIGSTLSGAIEYAHIKMPLTKILRDAHGLLDNIAKDQSGRDSIAVRVWKPGGKALEWVMPWKKALNEDGVLFIEQLAHEFSQDDKGETTFSSGFFYKIQERFDLLNPPTKIVVKKPTHKFKVKTKKTAILTPEQAITLLAVDYMASGDNQKITLEQAKEKITLLLTQCRSVTRILNDNNKERFSEPSEHLKADGAFLVRFLATKGM